MKKVFITGALVAGMAITACIGFKANASTSLKQIQFNYNGDNENMVSSQQSVIVCQVSIKINCHRFRSFFPYRKE